MSGNENNAANGEKNQEQSIFKKGMTFEGMKEKFEQKLDKVKAKTFEQKFEAKFKELDAATAIVNNINKELEKMYTEFNEGI